VNLGFSRKDATTQSSKHSDVLSNLRERKEGWKYAATVLGVVCAIMAFALVEDSGRVETVLEPYHISAASGNMPYNPSNLSESQQYLAILARSDLAQLLIWDPQTVKGQFEGFLNRCTPQAYAKWSTRMLKEAKQYNNLGMSESFYFQSEHFIPPDSVEISGMLVRRLDSKLLFRHPVQYIVSYAPNNGVFSVAQVSAQVQGSAIPRSVLHVQ
jgi:hypothetical protein